MERCLEAARLAPSACNSQPWHFIVVDTLELKDNLAKAAFSGIYSMNSFAKTAPVLIVMIREESKYLAHLAGALRNVQYNLIDLGITGEHFVLQAAEEGLGSCWLGWFDAEAVRKTLNLPPRTKIDAIISIGYPSGKQTAVSPRRDLNEISEFR